MLRQGFTFEEASLVNIAQISAIKELHACCRNAELSGDAGAAGAAAAAAAAALRTSPWDLAAHAHALQDCRDSADSIGRAAAGATAEAAQLHAVENALLGFQAAIGATLAHDTAATAAAAGANGEDMGAGGGSDDPKGVGGAYAGAMGAAHMLPDGKLTVPWAPLASSAQDACPQECARDGIADTGSEVSNAHNSADDGERGGIGPGSCSAGTNSERQRLSASSGKRRSCGGSSTDPSGQQQLLRSAFVNHLGDGAVKRRLSGACEGLAHSGSSTQGGPAAARGWRRQRKAARQARKSCR
jgi:hypothetical protein